MGKSLLSQSVKLPNLRAAWDRVADNRGAAGVDAVSVRRFARDCETRLLDLRQSVLGNTYKPQKLRHLRFAKPNGGWRTISICTVRDRVLQRAVLNVLEWPLDQQFLDCSFGYRPARSTQGAIEKVIECRDAGLWWVLDGDIEQFFESLDHELLLQFLREDVDDARTIALIEMWLKAGAKTPNSQLPTPKLGTPKSQLPKPKWGNAKAQSPKPNSKVGRRDSSREVGTPLGMVVSPLLSNVYLHRFDLALARLGFTLVRYADDFVVLGATREEVEEARRFVTWVLGYLRLRLSPPKTRVVSFDEGFDYLGVRFYRDTYSYVRQNKRVRVKGPPPEWDYPPPEWY